MMSKVLINLKKIDHYFYVITEIRKNKQTLRSSSYSSFPYINILFARLIILILYY